MVRLPAPAAIPAARTRPWVSEALDSGGDRRHRQHLPGLSSRRQHHHGHLQYVIGYNADVSAALTNATAIGYNASATTSNSLVLGSGANVGIGSTAPASLLTILGVQPGQRRYDPGHGRDQALGVTGGIGGDTTIATTGTGGIGSGIDITSGAGGVANSAATSSTGGKGGALTFTAGVGGRLLSPARPAPAARAAT